jgi:hypothetical protein
LREVCPVVIAKGGSGSRRCRCLGACLLFLPWRLRSERIFTRFSPSGLFFCSCVVLLSCHAPTSPARCECGAAMHTAARCLAWQRQRGPTRFRWAVKVRCLRCLELTPRPFYLLRAGSRRVSFPSLATSARPSAMLGIQQAGERTGSRPAQSGFALVAFKNRFIGLLSKRNCARNHA